MRQSAEGECKSLHTRIEKLDLELSIGDRPLLADQLIQPLVGHRAVALFVDIGSMRSTGWLSIDEHTKTHGSPPRCGSHNEMKIAGVKAIGDPPVGLVQGGKRLLNRPVTRQSPIIEFQARWGNVDEWLAQYGATG